MELKTFAGIVSDGIRKQLGEDYVISVITNLKNNSVELTGIMFKKTGERVSPTIYIEDLYEEYRRKKKTLCEITDEMIARYESSRDSMQELSRFDVDYENNKRKIVYRLISKERNKELLNDMPYIPFLDMAITFHMVISVNKKYVQSLKISKELQEKWNISVEQLLRIAKENTIKMFPAEVQGLKEFVREYLLNREEDLTNCGKVDMIVVTNELGINGATVILYDGIIEELAERYESDLYVIPSSIHEMIVVPAKEDPEKELYEILKFMVKDINEHFVADEEILSNRVYTYLRKEKRFV